jgi:glycosyltransferase involved in cell wall biosynthesis
VRVLVGTVEIGGHLADFAKAFEKLGHQVTSCVKERHWLFPDVTYDVDISFVAPDIVPWPTWMTETNWRLARLPRGAVRRLTALSRVLQLIVSHDLFVFQWAGTSLLNGNVDLSYLRSLGKKVVYIFNGDDVRHSTAYAQQCVDLFSDDYAAEMTRTQQGGLAQQLRNLRRPELNANIVFSLPNQAGLAIRPYMHSLLGLALSAFRFHVPGREKPVVVHAPSSAPIKGTSLIVKALDRLAQDGVEFELRLLQGVPHRQVLTELANADVAIDQLHYPLHGMFALEAMASGCAVATCNDERHEPLPRNRPIWHIDPQNVYERLKVLLSDRSLRMAMAERARRYVEHYHDIDKVAQRIIDCVEAPVEQRYDHYPTFFAKDYRLPAGSVLPPDVLRLNWDAVRRWGLPEEVSIEDMIERGLLPKRVARSFRKVPRWQPQPVPQAPSFCTEMRQLDKLLGQHGIGLGTSAGAPLESLRCAGL